MSKVDTSNFGPRAQEYFKAAKQKGTYIQNQDGSANKNNIRCLKQDVGPVQGPKSNIQDGQKNAFGGRVDVTA
ncbi:MAG: hypothetical protein WC314_13195 [Vulcanimicrobiota bacterium]